MDLENSTFVQECRIKEKSNKRNNFYKVKSSIYFYYYKSFYRIVLRYYDCQLKMGDSEKLRLLPEVTLEENYIFRHNSAASPYISCRIQLLRSFRGTHFLITSTHHKQHFLSRKKKVLQRNNYSSVMLKRKPFTSKIVLLIFFFLFHTHLLI